VQSYEGSADLSRAQHFKAHELWRVHADRAHTLEALIVLTECILDWDRLGGGDVVTGTPFLLLPRRWRSTLQQVVFSTKVDSAHT
jgi:hypothetical protein